MTTRTATIWIPDWPLVVALAVNDLPASAPAVLTTNKRIRIASGYARAAGIRTNTSLRHAQELIPNLHVLQTNPTLEAKEFEYVAQTLETLIPHLDILRPGLITFGATGPTRYFNGEEALADKIVNLLATEVQVESHVGFADGLLAAILSARVRRPIPVGESSAFLAKRPLSEAQYAMVTSRQRGHVRELVELWERLGIRTLGQLARLPRTKVHTRFGDTALHIHELANGKDLYSAQQSRSRPEVVVESTLEHAATRVDEAAFYARRLAQQIYDELVAQSATCGRIQIAARMSDGSELSRSWRTDESALGAISPERLTQRVRWQLEGWLTNSALRERAKIRKERKATGEENDLLNELEAQERLAELNKAELVWLQLTAFDVVGATTHQESLWGANRGNDLRAQRAVERVASLIGPQNVQAVVPKGGRAYQDKFELIPWDAHDLAADKGTQGEQAALGAGPWPGQLPSPGPTLLMNPPEEVDLLDAQGQLIVFNNRLAMSGPPSRLNWIDPRKQPLFIADWAGPWPITTKWWRSQTNRTLYLQLIPYDHQPLLVAYRAGAWQCEGIYD